MASKNYVNNKSLLESIVKYKEKLKENKELGKEPPKIPEYVGQAVLSIAKNLTTRGNFSGYTYKEDMISDGIEDCIKYLYAFDPEKSTNPFGYFSKIIWFAFLRRIAKEHKQQYLKHKILQQLVTQNSENADLISFMSPDDKSNDIIKNFEDKLDKKKDIKKNEE